MASPTGGAGLGRWPLWVRLVVGLLVLLAVALAATGTIGVLALRNSLLARVDQQLSSAAAPLAGRIEREIGGGLGSPARPLLPSQYYVEVRDANGSVLAVSSAPLRSGLGTPAIPALSVVQAAARGSDPFTVGATTGESRWRVELVPISDGSGYVAVAASLDEVVATTARLVTITLVVGVGALLVLAAAGWWVVRAGLRPLAAIEDTADAIAAGDLSRRVPVQFPRTEVGRLGTALNTMLERLEAAFRDREESEAAARRSAVTAREAAEDAQRSAAAARESEQRLRRFVADASHELRTPLTSIRGFAELYRIGAVREPADVSRAMGRIEDESARMGGLVEDMLLLARLDQHRALARDPVDLLELAADAVNDARAVDPQRPVVLVPPALGTAQPVVPGDEARLRQVVGNLVTNALTHTPAGTPVSVAVRVEGRDAVLVVADQGPGMAPEDARRAFERFYRADTSRTRATGGSGLGLSIVQAIVSAHDGSVELRTAPGAGAAFTVRLPLAAAEAAATSERPVAEASARAAAADAAAAGHAVVPPAPPAAGSGRLPSGWSPAGAG